MQNALRSGYQWRLLRDLHPEFAFRRWRHAKRYLIHHWLRPPEFKVCQGFSSPPLAVTGNLSRPTASHTPGLEDTAPQRRLCKPSSLRYLTHQFFKHIVLTALQTACEVCEPFNRPLLQYADFVTIIPLDRKPGFLCLGIRQHT